MIRNSNPGGLRPKTLPQGQSGVRTRDLRKQAALTPKLSLSSEVKNDALVYREGIKDGQQTETFCTAFIQRRSNGFAVGPALYKCYTNVCITVA